MERKRILREGIGDGALWRGEWTFARSSPYVYELERRRRLRGHGRLRSTAADVLVIHDDMDLPLGKVRFKRKGSPAVTGGIESIIEETGTSDFRGLRSESEGRLRVSIRAEYVLSRFSGDDEEILAEVIRLAAEATLDAVSRALIGPWLTTTGWTRLWKAVGVDGPSRLSST